VTSSRTWQGECIIERIYLQTGTTERPGGQQAGIPATAVRITHEPTGTMAQFGERSCEHENKRIAMSMIEYALIEAKWI